MSRIMNSGKDIISNLPSEIIDNVLCFLPLEDSVRTSILSKEWRYKWTTIPLLVLQTFPENCLGKYTVGNIIHHVLSRRNRSIQKLIIGWDVFVGFEDFDNIDRLFLLLSKHHIHEFELKIPHCDYVVSTPLFAFQHLKDLTLSNCELKPPPTFNGLKKLVSLTLKNVKFEPTAFHTFISQCPMLEKLTLDNCTDFEKLEINAPSLKYLNIMGNVTSIGFRKNSILTELKLSSPSMGYSRNNLYFNLQNAICSVPSLLKLSLCGRTLKFLARDYVPNQLPTTMEHLKFLYLQLNFNCAMEVFGAFLLIRSSPNLKYLEIDADTYHTGNNEVDVEFLRAHITSNWRLNNLRKLVRRRVQGYELEKDFLKYILAAAPVLQEIELTLPVVDLHFGRYRDLVYELKQIPRASPRISLSYQERDLKVSNGLNWGELKWARDNL